jgi:hypothetical protein
MSTTNCSRFPTISAANGSPPARLNGSSETQFALQTFRSFASRLRRPLTSILAQLSPSPSIASDRLGYPPLPTPRRTEVPLPPVNLTLVDSEELIREILIRIGEDPNRKVCNRPQPGLFVPGRKFTEVTNSLRRKSSSLNFAPGSTMKWFCCVTWNSTQRVSITCSPFMERHTSLISRTTRLSGYRNWHGYSRCMRGGSKYRSVSPKRWRRICKGFCNPKE